MIKLKPLLQEGWTCKRQVLDVALMRYIRKPHIRGGWSEDPRYALCINCQGRMELGVSRVWVLRDEKGHRRAVFCAIQCQRQYRFKRFCSEKAGD